MHRLKGRGNTESFCEQVQFTEDRRFSRSRLRAVTESKSRSAPAISTARASDSDGLDGCIRRSRRIPTVVFGRVATSEFGRRRPVRREWSAEHGRCASTKDARLAAHSYTSKLNKEVATPAAGLKSSRLLQQARTLTGCSNGRLTGVQSSERGVALAR